MEVVEFIETFSANYPLILDLLMYFAMITGTVCMFMALVYVAKMELYQTLPPNQMNYVRVFMLIFIGSLFVSFSWTLNMFAETFFDYGGFVLTAFENTSDWTVRKGLQPKQALQSFAILTCRIIGVVFGLWGLFTAAKSQMPDAQVKLWGGIVRVFVGAALFNPVGFMDLFGGWGTKYLVN